jgi:hypothetical protein
MAGSGRCASRCSGMPSRLCRALLVPPSACRRGTPPPRPGKMRPRPGRPGSFFPWPMTTSSVPRDCCIATSGFHTADPFVGLNARSIEGLECSGCPFLAPGNLPSEEPRPTSFGAPGTSNKLMCDFAVDLDEPARRPLRPPRRRGFPRLSPAESQAALRRPAEPFRSRRERAKMRTVRTRSCSLSMTLEIVRFNLKQ